jgi:hypothetical protein
VDAVWNPIQKELFNNQQKIEEEALHLYKENDPQKTIKYLNQYSNGWANKVVDEAWKLGDFLWTKYDEKF